jgi:GDP-L-fucose synthase
MDKSSKIYIAGHRGMVGSALIRALRARGYQNLVTRTRQELDLLDQAAVRGFMQQEKPDYIFLAAAKVGGIHANNTYPADFLYQNLVIEANIIHAAFEAAVQRLMFLASSCIYPRDCAQPIREEYLLTGPLESTNEAYAIAKIAGLKLCEAYNRQHGTRYVSVMPTNLYGPNDNFDLATSHVLPALLRKTHEAKMSNARALTIWGSGTPKREFLHVDDMAEACVHLMEHDVGAGLFNVGQGTDVSIQDLARSIMRVVGYDGELEFDRSRPDGTPRKLLDVSRLAALGWQAQRSLETGLRDTYAWYLARISHKAAPERDVHA